jgi:hypothetical protein
LANNVGTVNGTFTLDFVNARVPAFDLTTPVAVFSSANSNRHAISIQAGLQSQYGLYAAVIPKCV